MSSQVITTLPGTTNDYSSKNPSDSPISSETEIEPGKQKNFYRQVSGAGDGLPSQTTSDFGPKGLSKIVKMQENGDSVESGIGDVGEALPISEESNVSPVGQSNAQDNSKEMQLEPDWQKKIRSLQDQVNYINATVFYASHTYLNRPKTFQNKSGCIMLI